MTKIMLVEDDNNLREIYEARLAAEGYTIVSAQDGEAALALAAREHPDLVITDVMMPKISGFEMLDILRNTETLRDVKVIMLTALGQAEDNARADALGADRYLVKSQVTLEDIIKATHDVLEDPSTSPATETPTAEPAADTTPQAQPWQTAAPVAELQPEPTPAFDQPAVADAPQIDVVAPTEMPVADEFVASNDQPAASDSAPADDTVQASDVAFNDTATDDAQTDLASVDETQQAEIAAAPDASQEESAIRAQIDDFLDDPTTNQQTQQASETPEGAPAEEPTNNDQASSSVEFTPSPIDINPSAPAEEPESEYEKDAAAPDMGELVVQEPDAAQPTAEIPSAAPVEAPVEEAAAAAPAPAQEAVSPETAAPATPTPGYPSQPFELPVVPDATVSAEPEAQPLPEPATVEQQPAPQPSATDQMMSSAINDMVAGTPVTQPYAPASVEAVAPPAAEVASDQPSAQEFGTGPDATTPADQTPPAPTYDGSPAPVAHKLVISPMGFSNRPDINQLLAVEDAKAAANQAGAAQEQGQPPAAPSQPGQYGQPWQQPGQGNNNQPIDPNSISL